MEKGTENWKTENEITSDKQKENWISCGNKRGMQMPREKEKDQQEQVVRKNLKQVRGLKISDNNEVEVGSPNWPQMIQ